MDKKELIQCLKETIKELEESGDCTPRAAMIDLAVKFVRELEVRDHVAGQVLKDLKDQKPYLVNPFKLTFMMEKKEGE